MARAAFEPCSGRRSGPGAPAPAVQWCIYLRHCPSSAPPLARQWAASDPRLSRDRVRTALGVTLPVCAAARDVSAMPDEIPKLNSVIKGLARDPKRSPLFHWLMENHAKLEPATRGPRVNWAPLREKAIAHGITDADGNHPSEEILRRTFRKVEAEIAQRRAVRTREAASSINPSRLSPAWRPQPGRPGPPSPVIEPRHTPPSVPIEALPVVKPAVLDEVQAERVRQQTEILDAQIAYRDRFVNPPKRKA